MPLFIQSIVFVPISFFGGSRLILGSCEVRLTIAFKEIIIPGIIIPPRYSLFLFITEIVVAVPKSKIISGAPYSDMPATASTTRSLPSWAGLSVLIERPVFIPGPITIASVPVSFFTAVFIVSVTDGTTDEIIAPFMLSRFISDISSTAFREIAYSSGVAVWFVVKRSIKSILLFSQQPTTMFVFPTSIAKIIRIYPSFS